MASYAGHVGLFVTFIAVTEVTGLQVAVAFGLFLWGNKPVLLVHA